MTNAEWIVAMMRSVPISTNLMLTFGPVLFVTGTLVTFQGLMGFIAHVASCLRGGG